MKRVPKYRHHKATNQAYIEIKGKRIYLGVHGTPKSRKKYADKLTELNSGGGPALQMSPGCTTCAELVDAFTDYAEERYVKNGKQTTEVRSFATAVASVIDLYRDLPANEFGPTKLMACRQWLKQKGYCRKWINSYVGRIRRVWKWGVSRELVAETVWRALQSVEGLRAGEARDTPPVEPVPVSQVDALKPHLSPVLWGLIQFQLHTGCRPGEACAVRMCDLKITPDIWEYWPESHKTEHHGKRRVIFIGPKAQEVLKPFLRTETHVPLFRPRDAREWRMAQRRKRDTSKRRKKNPKRVPGEQYDAGSLGHAIRGACVRAKIDPWTPNQLRHTAGTLIRAAFGIEASRVVLGHSHVSTTEIYAEEDQSRAREVARKLG